MDAARRSIQDPDEAVTRTLAMMRVTAESITATARQIRWDARTGSPQQPEWLTLFDCHGQRVAFESHRGGWPSQTWETLADLCQHLASQDPGDFLGGLVQVDFDYLA